MALNTKYTLTFDVLESPSRTAASYTVNFKKEGYSGSVITFSDAEQNGLKSKITNTKDSIIGINEKKIDISILTDIDISELQTTKPKEWKVEIKKTVGVTVTTDFEGWLIPTNNATDYEDGLKYVRLEATDGLNFLKNVDFVDNDGVYYEGLTSIFEIIRITLQKTGLSLKINTINNTFGVNDDKSDSSEALKQRYLDMDLFRGENEPLDSYKVLSQIIETEKCRVYQEDGEWWIENISEKETGYVKSRKHDTDGSFLSGGTLNLRVDATHGSNYQPLEGGGLSNTMPIKWAKVEHKLGKFKNRLLNRDFRIFTSGNFQNWTKSNSGISINRTGSGLSGDQYGLKINGYADKNKNAKYIYQSIQMGSSGAGTIKRALNSNVQFNGQVFTQDVSKGLVQCLLFIDVGPFSDRNGSYSASTTVYGLSDTGEWIVKKPSETYANFIELENIDVNGHSKKTPKSWDITSKQIKDLPIRPGLFATVKYGWQDYATNVALEIRLFEGIDDIDPYPGETKSPSVTFKKLHLGWSNADTNLNLRELHYKATQDAYAPNNETFEAIYGDYVDGSNLSTLKDINGNITSNWVSSSSNTPKNFHTHGVSDILDELGITPKVYDGTIWGLLKYRHSVGLTGFANRGYIVGYTFNYSTTQCDVRIVEHSDVLSMTIKKTGVLSDGTEIEMVSDSLPSTYSGNGMGATTSFFNIQSWIQQLLGGIQGLTPNDEAINVVWDSLQTDDTFDFGSVVKRSDKLAIGSNEDSLEIGKNDSLTTVLGRIGVKNADNFLGEFSVSSLTANRVATLPDRNIEINKWADLSDVPTSFTPSAHFHEIGDINGLNTALNGKQPLNGNLNSLSVINTNGIVRRVGTNTFAIGTNDEIELIGDAYGTGTTQINVTLANSGVTSGTYTKVTVDAKGRVVVGSNPTTLADYGLYADFLTLFDTRFATKISDPITFGSSVVMNNIAQVNGWFTINDGLIDNEGEIGTSTSVLTSTGSKVLWKQITHNYISDWSASVLGQVLTGYTTGANTAIDSTNTVLTAFENLQAQVNAKANALSGTTNYLPKFTSSTAIGNSRVFDDGTNVGIGTATPNSKFDIYSLTTGNTSEYLQKWTFDKDNWWLGLEQKHVSGSHLQWNIKAMAAGTVSTYLSFKLGNLGIGTEDPSTQFHVYGANQATETAINTVTGGKSGAIYLQDSGGGAYNGGAVYFGAVQGMFAAIKGGIRDGGGNTLGTISFHTRPTTSSTTLTQRLLIDYNGNIGINTPSPSYLLDVNGTGRFVGAVQFDAIPSTSIAPTSANHLTNKAYVDSLALIKRGDTVKTISLANITLSGTQTVSGYALAVGDLCLVAGQTTASSNGVYVVASGSWTRSTTNDSDSEIRGAYHLITAGTYANSRYINTNTSAITVNTTAITYDVDFGAETDPVWTSFKTANDLTPTRISNWNTAYGWGNHSGLYVDKTSAQSDIAGAKKFTTSIQSPIIVAGTDSLNITFSNISGTSPRMASNGTLDFLANTRFDWLTTGNTGRMRLTTTGLRVGSTSNPSYMLHVSGTTGFEGLISVGKTSDGISLSSGSVGQFMRRSLVSNGFYNVDVNNWANIFVADISDIATYYQAKITGTTNYLTKKTSSNFGDSQIFDDGTSVVIGGTSAIDSSKFSVVGKIGATTLRIGDNSTGINIGSLVISSTSSLGYSATSHAWSISSTEKLNLNSTRLALTGNFELTGKLKVNGSFGQDHYFLKSLGVDGGGVPLGTEWAVMNCGEISDIDTLYASKTYADANYVKRITDDGERGFYMYGDSGNTVKEGFFFSNPDTGILGIHAYRLNGSTVQQYGFQLDKDGLPYWLFADGNRKRILTELDAVSSGTSGTTYTLGSPLYFTGNQINIRTASASQIGALSAADWTTFNNKQNTLVKADATHDGYLSKEDWVAFNAANTWSGGYVTSDIQIGPDVDLLWGSITPPTLSNYGARIAWKTDTPYLSTTNFGTGVRGLLIETTYTSDGIYIGTQSDMKLKAGRYFIEGKEIDMSGFATGKVLKATSSSKAEWVTP